MKKLIIFVCALICTVSCTFFAHTIPASARPITLSIAVQRGTLDSSIFEDFKDYYTEKTQSSINFNIQYADNPGELETFIDSNDKYDLVLADTFFLQPLYEKELIQQISHMELLNKEVNNSANISPFISGKLQDFERYIGNKTENVYFIGYSFETLGLLFNAEEIDKTAIKNWAALWDNRHNQSILFPNTVRQNYTATSIYLNSDTLENSNSTDEATYAQTLQNIISDFSPENIEDIRIALLDQKKKISPFYYSGYTDVSKKMLGKSKLIALTKSSLALQVIDSAGERGINLNYTIPSLGSEMYIYAFALPHSATENKTALDFIDFALDNQQAYNNMRSTRITSAIASNEFFRLVENNKLPQRDMSYFFKDATALRLDSVEYPSSVIADRLAVSNNFGDKTDIINKMWQTHHLNPYEKTIWVIGTMLALIFIIVILYLVYRRHQTANSNNAKAILSGQTVDETASLDNQIEIILNETTDNEKKSD